WFFVEGEEGMGGGSVTGVQTCALPICVAPRRRSRRRLRRRLVARRAGEGAVEIDDVEPRGAGRGEARRLRRRIVVEHGGRVHLRSEERRVGEAGGCRGGTARSESRERE